MKKVLDLICLVSRGPVLLEGPLVVAFLLIIPLARWMFLELLAVFSLFRLSLLPVSSKRFIAFLTVDSSMPRSLPISRFPVPRSCIRIIAALNSFILAVKINFI